jgi:hypothetical protein
MAEPGDPIAREARERAQLYLAALSTALWFLLVFGLAIALQAQNWPRTSIIIPIGFLMLPPAALPWLAYRPLARALARRRRQHLAAATRDAPP